MIRSLAQTPEAAARSWRSCRFLLHGRRLLLPADPLRSRQRRERSRSCSPHAEVGDEIVTTAGIYGTIIEIDDDDEHRDRRDRARHARSRWCAPASPARRRRRRRAPRTTTRTRTSSAEDEGDEGPDPASRTARTVRGLVQQPTSRSPPGEPTPRTRRHRPRLRPASRSRTSRPTRSSRSYIASADRVMDAMGYTEHGFRHANLVAKIAYQVLHRLGFTEREADLASRRRLPARRRQRPRARRARADRRDPRVPSAAGLGARRAT